MKSWLDWPDEDLRLRRAEALERAREELAEDIAEMLREINERK